MNFYEIHYGVPITVYCSESDMNNLAIKWVYYISLSDNLLTFVIAAERGSL